MKSMGKECSKMDSRSNVISEGNTNNRDSTTNVVSEGDTGSMEGILTSNPLVVVSNYRENDIAISNFKKTLGIAKETGDKYCEMQANFNLSNAYALTKQFVKVVSTAKECIRIIQEIGAKKAVEVDDCSSLYVAGICIKDTRLGNAAATAYFGLGSAEAHLSLFEDSLDSFHKCAEIAAAIGDERSEVMSCYGIAKLYEEKGQWDDVIKFSRKYIDKANLFCNKDMKIEAYLRLATAFFHTSNYEEVVVYSKKCIETMGCSWDTSGCRSECVRTLSILVQSCFRLNNYDETINYGRKYLQVAVNTGTKEAQMQAHHFLAAVYHQLHQIDRSCNHANNGMAIAEELKDDSRMGMFKPLLSVSYALVGMHEKASLLNPGIKTLFEVPTSPRQELEVLVKAVKAGDVNQQLQSQFRLYNYHKSKHQFERAIHCLKLAMELIPDGHDMKLFYYAPIAEMYIGMRKYEEGLKYCMGGLREVTGCKNEKFLFDFFFYISQLYAANGKWNLAEKYLKKAVQCFETLYGSVGGNEDFKMSMIDNYNKCFRFLSLVYVQTNRKKEALLVLDKCRARSLKEILVAKYGIQENKEASDTKPSDIEALVSDNKFAILYYSVCGFGNALAFLVGHNCFEASVQQLFFEKNKYHQILDKMFDEIEVLQKVNCEDRTLDSKQDIKDQKQEEEADDEREILIVELQKRKFFVHKKTIMMECQGEKRRATVLEFLYSLILGEGQSLIKQSEIIVIPDGSLCKIPFAALQDPSTGKYLSETKRIRLAPSLAVLKLLRENAGDCHCSGDALVIGDPHVGKVMFDGKEDEISRLEKAQIEAKVVASCLNVEPLLGDKATKPAVLEKLRQGVFVVHIAAHGILSKATIVLAPSPEIRETKPIPDEEDYMLTMADVQQAQVRAQLVVLSCCHSGRGEIRAEGVVGMCRAFLASGARAVVASLWAIDDKATLEFMAEFYFHLRTGKSAGTSLQLTMNEMRNTDPRPMYWAPFFLMGDDVTIKFT